MIRMVSTCVKVEDSEPHGFVESRTNHFADEGIYDAHLETVALLQKSFSTFEGAIGRYFPERGFLEVWSWMVLEAMLVIPPKVLGGSRIFPRRRLSDDPAIIADAPVPGADTGRLGCGRPSGRCTIWATRCPDGRDSWRLPTRNITALPVGTISTPTCWIWPCPTPITPIG